MTAAPPDDSHDPTLRSWVGSANLPGCDFPVQNLPLARFRRAGTDEAWRVGVAIGDQVLDLRLAREQCPWSAEAYALLEPLAAGDLASVMARDKATRQALRLALSAALRATSMQAHFLELCLVARDTIETTLPCAIGDYTDFYAGIHHAMAVGSLFRPDNPLLPNYKWLPIGYHGRASSVIASPQAVQRPCGQLKTVAEVPLFGPSTRLDYELELGAFVGVGNPLGEPVSMADAEARIFGLTLLNDWSARDIQGWEYQPLGPFLSKSFATSVSPWLVTMEALAPFRVPFTRPAGDPRPLAYLDSDANRALGAIAITLEVWLQTAQMRSAGDAPVRLSQSNFRDAYWTLAQLVAHHTSNGCNLRTGDLLGTGTLSGPAPGQGGSLLELSLGGRQTIRLPNGQTRSFLEDGDTVVLRAFCEREGAVRIGFGEVSGTVLAATAPA